MTIPATLAAQLCVQTPALSEKEYAYITFEYVTGPVIHNKYMSMKNIYWVNDGEAPHNTRVTLCLWSTGVDDCK